MNMLDFRLVPGATKVELWTFRYPQTAAGLNVSYPVTGALALMLIWAEVNVNNTGSLQVTDVGCGLAVTGGPSVTFVSNQGVAAADSLNTVFAIGVAEGFYSGTAKTSLGCVPLIGANQFITSLGLIEPATVIQTGSFMVAAWVRRGTQAG